MLARAQCLCAGRRCAARLAARTLATRRRKLPPSVSLTNGAQRQIAALLQANLAAGGVRLTMTNDWGSHTGFSYNLGFVAAGEELADDEQIELAGGALLFVDRKALWAGEGGLLGALVDIHDDFTLRVIPKQK